MGRVSGACRRQRRHHDGGDIRDRHHSDRGTPGRRGGHRPFQRLPSRHCGRTGRAVDPQGVEPGVPKLYGGWFLHQASGRIRACPGQGHVACIRGHQRRGHNRRLGHGKGVSRRRSLLQPDLWVRHPADGPCSIAERGSRPGPDGKRGHRHGDGIYGAVRHSRRPAEFGRPRPRSGDLRHHAHPDVRGLCGHRQ